MAASASDKSPALRRHVRYLAGNAYSIADIAVYPWMLAATTFLKEPLARGLAEKLALHRWLQELEARPAVQRGMQVPRV